MRDAAAPRISSGLAPDTRPVHHTDARPAARRGRGMASDFDRLIAKRLRRRDFMRYAGIAAGAGVLASCKKVSSSASAASGSARPPIAQEPGGLTVFDWAGYGGGEFYPGKEVQIFTDPYKVATGDTPKFVLFENDDDGYTKVVSGNAPYDVVHPC